MAYNYLDQAYVDAFIEAALKEDIGPADYSTISSIPKNVQGRARLLCKSEGVAAGVALAVRIFYLLDSELKVSVKINDGEPFTHGSILFNVEGPARSILSAERLVLNCLQRMSGIATHTARLTSLISNTKTKILDTRKTTPNFRICEKWAVKIGGGENHRFGLFDMIMLKDNHIDFAGGIKEAITNCQKYLSDKNLDLQIIVETRNLDEVAEACNTGGIKRLLLDNMSPDMVAEAVKIIDGKFESEVSGGINEGSIALYAQAGIDYISMGALTHSSPSLDLSLKAEILP